MGGQSRLTAEPEWDGSWGTGKNFPALHTGSGHDVKLRVIASPDRFLAQPKWEMSVKIAPHTAPLLSTAPLLTADSRIVFLCGQDRVWKQTSSLQALFAE